MPTWTIGHLEPLAAAVAIPALAEILVDCVEGGASVGFLSPLTLDRAADWWRGILASAGRGERIVFVARDPSGIIQGTGQLVFAQPENQPHRADVSKLLVHRRARRTGAGELLMREIERVALAEGRTVLVLDTATPEAERIYDRLGWSRLGVIPTTRSTPTALSATLSSTGSASAKRLLPGCPRAFAILQNIRRSGNHRARALLNGGEHECSE